MTSPPIRRAAAPDGLHIHDRMPLDGPAGGGAAARVVMVHGAMDRGGSFGRVAQRLRDLEVVTYDRRGYARSKEAGQAETFDDQVADLLAVLDGRRAVVAGHSFGGNVALAAAAAAPDLVPAVVVFEPPAPWTPDWPSRTRTTAPGRTPEEVAEAFMRRMVGNRIWEHLPAATQQARRSEGITLLTELEVLGDQRPYDPALLTMPVLVGWGTESAAHMQTAARQLAAELPNSRAVEVEGCSHGVHLSHPGVLADMIRTAIALGG